MADVIETGKAMAALWEGGTTEDGRKWRVRFLATQDGWRITPNIPARHAGEFNALADYGSRILPWADYAREPSQLIELAEKCLAEARAIVAAAAPPQVPLDKDARSTREYLAAKEEIGDHLTAAAGAILERLTPRDALDVMMAGASRVAALAAIGAGYTQDVLMEEARNAWGAAANDVKTGDFKGLRFKLDS